MPKLCHLFDFVCNLRSPIVTTLHLMTLMHPGDPIPDVAWYKGEKKVKARRGSARIKTDWDMLTDVHTLEIKDATEDDAGDYVLIATSETGSNHVKVPVSVTEKHAKEQTEVAVAEEVKPVEAVPAEIADQDREPVLSGKAAVAKEPIIEISPQPAVVKEGEQIKLACKVKGQEGNKNEKNLDESLDLLWNSYSRMTNAQIGMLIFMEKTHEILDLYICWLYYFCLTCSFP